MTIRSISTRLLSRIVAFARKTTSKPTKTPSKRTAQRSLGKPQRGKETRKAGSSESPQRWVMVEAPSREVEDENEFLMKKCGKHKMEERIDLGPPLQSNLCHPDCNNIVRIFFRGFSCEECKVFAKPENEGKTKLQTREYDRVMVDYAENKAILAGKKVESESGMSKTESLLLVLRGGKSKQ
ncbi:hypothetical protein TWF281_006705 [Arthrobotrys megalospora]